MTGLLFLCVANSARSQLAEAISRHLITNRAMPNLQAEGLEVWSAGTRPSHVRPQVPTVLQEENVDFRGLRSKGLIEIPWDEIKVIVTLCEDEQCARLPIDAVHIHWPLPDPAAAPDEEALEAFRATRDELLRRLPKLIRGIATADDLNSLKEN